MAAQDTTKKQYTFSTSLYPPPILSNPKPTLLYPTPLNPHPSTNNPVFTASMHIRHSVFVEEQLCRAEEEIDADDERSWGWVVYASEQQQQQQQHRKHQTQDEDGAGDEGPKQAVATIRLVPAPHIAHTHLCNASESTAAGDANGKQFDYDYDYDHEPYVKITRVAVLAPFRGYGLSRLLMRTVEEWAARNKRVIDEMYARFASQQGAEIVGKGPGKEWNGLIGLHAQTQVERMYAALGYETDESMGRWDEEGIDHVGMFKRVDITS
ncbi:hypothetical protein TMatcc_005217 [Talaromyces marneffei ATCC 18224]|uniref:Acetyltransferase, GNAT family, putative n=1 Tax=Talaromyces marneffei (strain ATCC 18224 / CBS 334.59 / QM 7333) TaxID=441960 RepID=B6QBR3_TALMQ|nr:uncharacterized protein EYB26_006216 [Talaromyces marneffei]EEA26504.1 acetyltransferase, GNAT family, putative [Talaromyces marneffei ATCC 18224]QGA18531.1 hypothetical protein EYB26_006216 [Talaromyces marneffei]